MVFTDKEIHEAIMVRSRLKNILLKALHLVEKHIIIINKETTV